MPAELGRRSVVAFARELQALEERGYVIEYAEVLVRTFPWWKRTLAFLVWRPGPVRRRLGRRFVNPYNAIRATIRPPTDAEGEEDLDGQIKAQAADEIASGSLPLAPERGGSHDS